MATKVEEKKPPQVEHGEMEVRGLTHIFDPEGTHKVALKDCSFKVPKEKFTTMVGPSGSGKTTLINLMAGYFPPTSGEMLIDGKPVIGPCLDRLVIFQETSLFPWMSTLENALFGPRVQGKNIEEKKKEALALIEMVGLKGFEDKYPIQLSGGMQRRAELVRTLINNPRVMLMDEPFRGLDAMTREIMQEHTLQLYEDTKMTTFFITAEIDEAIYMGDILHILSATPGTVRTTIEIDLPRPRDFRMLASEHFMELEKKVVDIVHEESIKAFEAGKTIDKDALKALKR